jgi:hypothetical protein
MSRRKRYYRYTNAATSSTGIMVCSVCRKAITEGEYRYFDNGDAYINQHRACTESDAQWALMDHQRIEGMARYSKFVAACVEFKAKWGVTELDEYIGEET